MNIQEAEQAGPFTHCAGCPSRAGCSVASYCVIESRFHYPDQSITAPQCGTCSRRAADGGWSCLGSGDPTKSCDAQSETWGQWFMVQMYAVDEQHRRAAAATGAADGADVDDDDDEPCYHDCNEECYDYQGLSACRHSHCFNCGGCQCPGYCDDYQTYNLRPAETGGASE